MHAKQYTIRNIPKSVDQALRKKAEEEKKSLNTILIEVLTQAVGARTRYHDLNHLAGSWISDPEVEKAFAEQRKVDPKDWK